MRQKILLFILLVFSKILFSAEVKLRSENVFICDILEENSNSVTILYKEQKYKISRGEILAINPDITGKHSAYQNTIITLNDKSIVKGRLTEETPEMITIWKDSENFAIPRNTIKDIKRSADKEYLLPESYKVIEKEKIEPSWNLGFYGVGFQNGHGVGETNRNSLGAGVFTEPSFLKMSDRWLLGFQSELLSSSGQLNYSFFQNFIYAQFNHIILGQNLYYKIGIGSSYVSTTDNGLTASIFRPALTGEFGWQSSLRDKYILRIGIRENGVFENPKIWDAFGLQISFGYRL